MQAIWNYRYFILSSIRNELVSRFARSKLGATWMIINPLAQVAIYALILSSVLSAKLPDIDNRYAYAIYLMAGLLGWTLFSEIISRCVTLFVDQGNLIKKMSFPRITLPVIVVGSCLLNNILLLLIIIAVFAFLGQHFSLVVLWLLPLSIITITLAISLGLILGVMNVFVRDIGQVTPIALQMLFWLTPIVYPISIIPEYFQHILGFNPLFVIVHTYQDILVYNKPPQVNDLLIMGSISLSLSLLSLFIFRRANSEIVDAL